MHAIEGAAGGRHLEGDFTRARVFQLRSTEIIPMHTRGRPKNKARQADSPKRAGRRAQAEARPWDDDFDPRRETWDPEPLDDEPDPEPGDFWLEPDAFDE